MENIILPAAIVFLLAALLGGNVEALGIKIPTVNSVLVRIILGLCAVGGVAYAVSGKVEALLNQKLVRESLSVHKDYVLGFNNTKTSTPATSDITWIPGKIYEYDKGLYSIVYSSPGTGQGFVVFRVNGKKLFGLWKDDTNKDHPLPGTMEMEFGDAADGQRIAEGYWSYGGSSDKYFCYLKEVKK